MIRAFCTWVIPNFLISSVGFIMLFAYFVIILELEYKTHGHYVFFMKLPYLEQTVGKSEYKRFCFVYGIL